MKINRLKGWGRELKRKPRDDKKKKKKRRNINWLDFEKFWRRNLMRVFLRIFSQLKENLKSFEKRLMWVGFLMNEGKNLTFFFFKFDFDGKRSI